MRIRRLEIEGYRGIRSLKWDPKGDFICLVGPGDSTKTTVLDALEAVLAPRWNVQFDDTDFYDAKTQEPILITATLGDLPEEFKRDSKYGYLTRGWSPAGDLHDEPRGEDELAVSIQLRVDASLEPSWTVVNDREPDGKEIGRRDRETIGCIRLTDYVDRHFAWGKSSILSRLTTDSGSLAGLLAEAGRSARRTVCDLEPTELQALCAAADKAKLAGEELGVTARSEYRPSLDVRAISVGEGGLALHDGEIPLRRAGLGTRRLLSMAMQREVGKAGGITLVDEVEYGLEPHRIRHLVRTLQGGKPDAGAPQVILTTHAPVVLEELKAVQLRVVRSDAGTTRILDVPDTLQPVVRRAASAFLARRILVCEGKTELGLCRCVFRSKPNTHSTARRTPIPRQGEHSFQSKPNTDSTPRRTVLSPAWNR